MTVPSFVAATGLAQETANPSLTIPSAISAGDLMVLMCCSINDNAIATPSGWTFKRGDAGGANTHIELMLAVYVRYATSGDPGSTLNLTIAGRNITAIAAYSGVRPSTPVAGVASSGQFSRTETQVSTGHWNTGLSQTANATLTAPTVTPDSADVAVLRLWFGSWDQVTTFPTLTLPATSRTNQGGTLLDGGVSDESLSGSGPSGTNTATNSVTGWSVATTLLLGSHPLGGWQPGIIVRRKH